MAAKVDQPAQRSPFAKVFLAVLLVVGLIASLFAWNVYKTRQQRDATLGVLLQSFRKQNSLVVFQAQVPVIVESSECFFFCRFRRRQIAVVPAQVDYRLDLSQLRTESMSWNAETQTMNLTLPEVDYSEPVLDAARVQVINDGILTTADKASELFKRNMILAKAKAKLEAANPQLLQMARDAAKEAMWRNIMLPLQAAGYENAKVQVRFATEGYSDGERSEASRPVQDVVQGRKLR